MCISASPAQFSGTTGYIGERLIDNEVHHIVGYQNKPSNLTMGPNAMILHFPSKEVMTKDNTIDMGPNSSSLMKNWRERFEPLARSKSLSRGIFAATNSVEIFDIGVYTVALSAEPSLIYDALGDIPEEKRPSISKELMQWYEENYPKWSIALCCFNRTPDQKADPLFWWYKPTDENKLIFPSVDCHTGGVPNLEESVQTDHVIVMNSDQWDDSGKAQKLPSSWMDDYSIPKKSRKFFNEDMGLIGIVSNEKVSNGDFMITTDSLRMQRSQDLSRIKPVISLT